MFDVEQWFKRKMSLGAAPLLGMSTVTYEYDRIVGPRSIYGKVVLAIEPADTFLYKSSARWPEDNYDPWVIDGILDALFSTQHKPLIGARFELKEIDWHPVNSAPIAYYWAARNAVTGVLAWQR
jgi:hypothetical protein